VVDAYPNACWSKAPYITDDSETEDETPFEKAVNELFLKHNLFFYLKRLDILQRIGSYAVLVIGSSDLSTPLLKMPKFSYAMPYGEGSALISTYNSNANDPRFGMPETYTINVGITDVTQTTINVHHSNVIHVAERALENNVVGSSCLKPIYNDLIDLTKVVGGASECFWLNARGGLHINSDAPLGEDAVKTTKEKMEELTNKLSRILVTQNSQVAPLNYQMHSPKEHFEVLIACISGATGIPQNILTGNETGVRASSQDVDNWYSRVEERQNTFCEPFMLRPLLDRLITLGTLPQPQNGKYMIEWQKLGNPNALEQADVALKKIQAINAYASGMGDTLVPPEQACEIIGIEYREDDVQGAIEAENDDILEAEKAEDDVT
jgi:hypothetical protein